MSATHLASALFLAGVTLTTHALPFTAHTSAPVDINGSFNWSYYASEANSGRFQGAAPRWYFGGRKMSAWPKGGTTELPVITLPQWIGGTEIPLTHSIIDADNDGDLDIVRLIEWHHDGYNTIQTYLNNGGTFTLGPRVDWVQPDYYAIEQDGNWRDDMYMETESGDYDRDGDVDLAVLITFQSRNTNVTPNRHEGRLLVRWNDGTGRFGTVTTLQSTGFSQGANVESGDIDRDGDVDLVCTWQEIIAGNGTSTFSTRLFENNGQGQFTGTSIPGQLEGLVMRDINRDGAVDMVALDRSPGKLSTFLNDGSGTFNPGIQTTLGYGLFWVADLDGDGMDDIAKNHETTPDKLMLYRGAGDGYFFAQGIEIATLPTYCVGLAAADSDADGDLDLIANLPVSSDIQNGPFIYLENRQVHRTPAIELTALYDLAGVTKLETGEFTGDGREDLIAVTPSQKKLWLAAGEADGTPGAPVFKNTQNAAPYAVTKGDFNRDGRLDLAYTLPVTGQVRLALNNGGVMYTWADSLIGSMPGAALITPGQYSAADGHTNLLVSSSTTGAVRWYHQATNNSWLAQSVLSSYYPAPNSLVAANASSRPGDEVLFLAADASNLVVRGYHLESAWTYLGGIIQTRRVPSTTVMKWADATNTGRSRLVFVQGDGYLSWWDVAGGGSSAMLIAKVASGIRDFAPLDYDRDGRTDFLCATSTGLVLVSDDGSGVFRESLLYARTGGFDAVAGMDLNRDGFIDVAAASESAGRVYFFRNRSNFITSSAPLERSTVFLPNQDRPVLNATVFHTGELGSGNRAGDAPIAVASTGITFREAVLTSGGFTPGGAMTKAKIDETVASISLYLGSVQVATATTAPLASSLTIPLTLSAEFPFNAGENRELTVRVRLKPGAASASYKQLYVLLEPVMGRELDGIGTPRAALTGDLPPPRGLINIVPEYTALQEWRNAYFGAPHDDGPGANEADADGDGILNIFEYLMGGDPTVRNSQESPALGLTMQGRSNPLIADVRLASGYDPNVRLTLQHSTSTTGWTVMSTRTGPNTWTGTVPAYYPIGSGRTRFDFNTGIIPSAAPGHFFRLRAEELP